MVSETTPFDHSGTRAPNAQPIPPFKSHVVLEKTRDVKVTQRLVHRPPDLVGDDDGMPGLDPNLVNDAVKSRWC